MSQRRDAWMRQAQSDFDVGVLTQAKEFHSQACYHYSQAAEKALKGLLISLRMNSETRYPRDDEAPMDRFDSNDSEMAQEAAKAVLRFVESVLG